MSPSGSSAMIRLGPKHTAVSSPYRGIYPRRAEPERDSGLMGRNKTEEKTKHVSFQSENKHQTEEINSQNNQSTNVVNEFCMQTMSSENEINKNMNKKNNHKVDS
jgi:hypothetical protein